MICDSPRVLESAGPSGGRAEAEHVAFTREGLDAVPRTLERSSQVAHRHGQDCKAGRIRYLAASISFCCASAMRVLASDHIIESRPES